MNSMTMCSLTLIFVLLAGLLIFAFRKPSKEEILKFKNKKQDQINWSNIDSKTKFKWKKK